MSTFTRSSTLRRAPSANHLASQEMKRPPGRWLSHLGRRGKRERPRDERKLRRFIFFALITLENQISSATHHIKPDVTSPRPTRYPRVLPLAPTDYRAPATPTAPLTPPLAGGQRSHVVKIHRVGKGPERGARGGGVGQSSRTCVAVPSSEVCPPPNQRPSSTPMRSRTTAVPRLASSIEP